MYCLDLLLYLITDLSYLDVNSLSNFCHYDVYKHDTRGLKRNSAFKSAVLGDTFAFLLSNFITYLSRSL